MDGENGRRSLHFIAEIKVGALTDVRRGGERETCRKIEREPIIIESVYIHTRISSDFDSRESKTFQPSLLEVKLHSWCQCERLPE